MASLRLCPTCRAVLPESPRIVEATVTCSSCGRTYAISKKPRAEAVFASPPSAARQQSNIPSVPKFDDMEHIDGSAADDDPLAALASATNAIDDHPTHSRQVAVRSAQCEHCRASPAWTSFLPASRVILKTELQQYSDEDLRSRGVERGHETLHWQKQTGVNARFRTTRNERGYQRIDLVDAGGGYVKCKIVPIRPVALCRRCTFKLNFANLKRYAILVLIGAPISSVLLFICARAGTIKGNVVLMLVGLFAIASALCALGGILSFLKDSALAIAAAIGWRSPMGRLAALRHALPDVEIN